MTESNPFWIKSPSIWIDSFMKLGSASDYEPGSILYLQGNKTDSIYYLLEGQVKVIILWEDGSERTLGMHESGSIIGEMSALDQQPQFTSGIVTKPSKIIQVNIHKFIDSIYKDKDLLTSFLQDMARKVRLLSSQVSNMSFLNVEKRICYTLLKLAQDQGIPTPQGLKISSRLTDQELANLVGTSRVTVSRVLNSLKKHNFIDKLKNHLYILNEDDLKTFTFSKNSLTWKSALKEE